MDTQYRALDVNSLPDYLANLPTIKQTLGGSPDTWSIKEMGDGNLNLVFIVKGDRRTLIVKQALPYLRLVGDSWPLPLERAYFEHEALVREAALVPDLVPEQLHFDKTLALNVMAYCSPHIILRKGFIAGTYYPHLADHISTFMAETLFKTSDLYLKAAEKKPLMKLFCDNIELCKITEDLVFTFPYMLEESNRWTSPDLDDVAQQFRIDSEAKLAAQQLKEKFLTQAQALIHADLHSGSVMVTETDTKVIDPEFAFVGPMGFDIGAFLGNILLAYFSQPGHANAADDRHAYSDWLLRLFEQTWNLFQQKFLTLWQNEARGDCYMASLFSDTKSQEALRDFKAQYMQTLLTDSIAFAGLKMIRRILGLAHVEDLESIANQSLRADCEKQALHCARHLLVNAVSFGSIEGVTAHIKQMITETMSA